MKHLFVPYHIALALKEKGFDAPCIASYSDKNTFNFTTGGLMYKTTPEPEVSCIAPLYQQVIDWLRETKNIVLTIRPYNKGLSFFWTIISADGEHDSSGKDRQFYLAFNDGIEEALKLI